MPAAAIPQHHCEAIERRHNVRMLVPEHVPLYLEGFSEHGFGGCIVLPVLAEERAIVI